MNPHPVHLDPLPAALRGEAIAVAWLNSRGKPAAPPEAPAGILPGSFNPLHSGHVALRDAAAEFLGDPVCFELTMKNADKPPLESSAVLRRIGQFSPAIEPIAVSNAATFVEKSRLFPGATFVVGIDTAERILQARFYSGRGEEMQSALGGVRQAGCRFLVAGRAIGGEFITLRQLSVPADLADLFVELPEQRFRADVSSTELRRE